MNMIGHHDPTDDFKLAGFSSGSIRLFQNVDILNQDRLAIMCDRGYETDLPGCKKSPEFGHAANIGMRTVRTCQRK